MTIGDHAINGGQRGVDIQKADDQPQVVLENVQVVGQEQFGVFFGDTDGRLEIHGGSIHDTDSIFGVGVESQAAWTIVSGVDVFGHRQGIRLRGPGVVRENRVFGNRVGIQTLGGTPDRLQTIENNRVLDNSEHGIRASSATTGTPGVIVRGNEVFGQTTPNAVGVEVISGMVELNEIHSNRVGLRLTGQNGTISQNRFYNHDEAAIDLDGANDVVANQIYSNGIAIRSQRLPAGRRGTIANNVLYDHRDVTLDISAATELQIFGNTIWHPVGTAIRISGASSNVAIVGNLVRLESGAIFQVDGTATTAFSSEDNVFDLATMDASVGIFSGVSISDLSTWQATSLQDTRSVVGDANWIDPDGIDNRLGFDAIAGVDFGRDDGFLLGRQSIAIDRVDAALMPDIDSRGFSRSDDPSTPNAGPNADWIADAGAIEFGGDSSDEVPPVLVSTSPAELFDGGRMSRSFDELTLQFSETIQVIGDPSAGVVAIQTKGADDIWGTADDAAIASEAVVGVDRQSLDVRLPGGLLDSGDYRLVVRGSGLLDRAGNGLAGMQDGTPGQDAVIEFQIPEQQVLVNLPKRLELGEGGVVSSFEVRLSDAPTSQVVIDVSVDDASEASLSASSLRFDASNFDTPQEITIAGVDDDEIDGDIVVSVVFGDAVSNDDRFAGLRPAPIEWINRDNDPSPLVWERVGDGRLNEAGNAGELTLRLTAIPAAPVQIPITVSDPTLAIVEPAVWLVDPAVWGVDPSGALPNVTIQVRPMDDDFAGGDVPFEVELGPATSDDLRFDGIIADSVNWVRVDDDQPGFVVSPLGPLTIDEQSRGASIELRGTSRPTADVVVNLNLSDIGEATIDTTQLVITPENWNQPQSVQIRGVRDDVPDGDQVIKLRFEAAISDDPDFNGRTIDPISITVEDIDIAGQPTIVARHVFYNGSRFDGNDSALNAADDSAIATDKRAFIRGDTVSFANYTSFQQGINGIMLDVVNFPGEPTLDDFLFRFGNNNAPGRWEIVQAEEILVRPGAGANRSDRISIRFADGQLTGGWLLVQVRATSRTGLAGPDLSFFGNAVGETGNSTLNTYVDRLDDDQVLAGLSPSVSKTNPLDFNRDGVVDAVDRDIVAANQTYFENDLNRIAPPLPGGAASPDVRRFDVNRDGSVTPLDALNLVNHLIRRRRGTYQPPDTDSGQLIDNIIDDYDVNFDDQVSPLDAVQVLNHIRREQRRGGGEAEASDTAMRELYADPILIEEAERKKR
ncbi:MAG: right-handed parallel beta-helix repeat-containing protein [Planctomycetota bacterium]